MLERSSKSLGFFESLLFRQLNAARRRVQLISSHIGQFADAAPNSTARLAQIAPTRSS
jgi:hypothetical protein